MTKLVRNHENGNITFAWSWSVTKSVSQSIHGKESLSCFWVSIIILISWKSAKELKKGHFFLKVTALYVK